MLIATWALLSAHIGNLGHFEGIPNSFPHENIDHVTWLGPWPTYDPYSYLPNLPSLTFFEAIPQVTWFNFHSKSYTLKKTANSRISFFNIPKCTRPQYSEMYEMYLFTSLPSCGMQKITTRCPCVWRCQSDPVSQSLEIGNIPIWIPILHKTWSSVSNST